MKNALLVALCFKPLVIAPSGRQVCERVRLAGALACLACARRFAGGLRASARQFACGQMRYNALQIGVSKKWLR